MVRKILTIILINYSISSNCTWVDYLFPGSIDFSRGGYCARGTWN